jgi:hypothetical protein
MTDLTVEQLRAALSYEPETGQFVWLNCRKVDRQGCPAGSLNKALGYVLIGLNGTLYYAHRLAIFYVTGNWPEGQVDHKNMDRSDNRFGNLREATKAENMQNRGAPSNNSSGHKGVSFNRALKKWHAYIGKGRRIHLGYFTDIRDAQAAYLNAANDLHEDFARTVA